MAGSDAAFLRPLANCIMLASQFYSGSVGVCKHVNMDGYKVVNRPGVQQNVLEIMNSKRKLGSKD